MDRASLAVTAATSYRFDLKMTARITTKSDSGSEETSLSLWSSGALDIVGRKMEMLNALNVRLPPSQPAPPLLETTFYIVGDTIYIKGFFDDPEQWAKTSVPEEYWEIQNQAKQQTELLRLSEVTALPLEIVRSGGLDIYTNVLLVNPNLERFWELMAQQPGLSLPPEPPTGVPLNEIVKIASMKLWLTQTTDLPLKVEMQMNLQIDPTKVPEVQGEVSIYIVITTLFSDYNQPLSIELPPEAQTAIELE